MILNRSGCDDYRHQQPHGINEEVSFAPFDLLTTIVTSFRPADCCRFYTLAIETACRRVLIRRPLSTAQSSQTQCRSPTTPISGRMFSLSVFLLKLQQFLEITKNVASVKLQQCQHQISEYVRAGHEHFSCGNFFVYSLFCGVSQGSFENDHNK